MTSNEQRVSGFTLVEALIALTVFSVGIMAVWKMYSTVYTYDAVSDRLTCAVNIADDEAEELKTLGYASLANGSNSAVRRDAREREYRLVTSISDTANGTNKRIILQVGWQDGGSLPADIADCKRRIRISTLVSDLE